MAGGLTLLDTWVEFPGVTYGCLTLPGLGVGTQNWWSNSFSPVDGGPPSRCARPEMLVPASWRDTGQLGEPEFHPEWVWVLYSALGLEAADTAHWLAKLRHGLVDKLWGQS